MSQQEFVLILFQVIVLVLAFSVHESAHAYVAMRLGDPTAYMLGRVTLNPMKHLDPLGSVILPLVALVYHWPLLGWAKPCPVTPRNFRNYKRDDILVSLAGPVSNLAMEPIALVLLIVFMVTAPMIQTGVVNLIPVPPLDGSHVLRQFLPYRVEQVYDRVGRYGLLIVFFFGGSLIFGTFYYPLLRIFNHLLMAM